MGENGLNYNFMGGVSNESSLYFGSKDVTTEKQAEGPLLFTLVVKVLVALVGVCMIFATIIGNILVCVAIRSERPLQQVQNVLLVSLAASDILIGALVLPLGLIYNLTDKWVFGKWLCEVWKACDVLGCTASILNLCFISVDRYLSIRIPFKYGPKRTYRLMSLMIATCWLLSLAIGLPPIFGWKTKKDIPQECLYPTDIPAYVIYSILFSFYIPNSVMLFVYVNIYRLAMKQISKKKKRTATQLKLVEIEQNNNINANTAAANDMRMIEGEKKQNFDNSQGSNSNKSKHSSSNEGGKSPVINKNSIALQEVTPEQKASALVPSQLIPDDLNSQTGAEQGVNNNNNNKSRSSFIRRKKLSRSSTPIGPDGERGGRFSPAKKLLKKPTPVPSRALTQVAILTREKQKAQKEKERRAIVVLGVVMVTFLACWLPFFVFYPIISLCGKSCETPTTIMFLQIFTYFGWLNSALNPIIYTIFNMEFRTAFRRILSPFLKLCRK